MSETVCSMALNPLYLAKSIGISVAPLVHMGGDEQVRYPKFSHKLL